jgi:hypothetical protein
MGGQQQCAGRPCPRPLPQGKALLIGLARVGRVRGKVVGQTELHQRPRRTLILTRFLQQLQRLLVVGDGLLVGIQPTGTVSGRQEVVDSLFRQGPVSLLALRKVVRQLTGHSLRLSAVQALHGQADPPVQVAAAAARHPRIHHLADHGVAKGIVPSGRSAGLLDQAVQEEVGEQGLRLERGRLGQGLLVILDLQRAEHVHLGGGHGHTSLGYPTWRNRAASWLLVALQQKWALSSMVLDSSNRNGWSGKYVVFVLLLYQVPVQPRPRGGARRRAKQSSALHEQRGMGTLSTARGRMICSPY